MDVFRTSGLIPDVLDEVPPAALKIKFGNAELRPGDTQTPTNVKDVPSVTIEQDASEFFTLICHDPDAPSREDPKFGEFQHWLVMNITNNDINTGEELTTYIGSGAPKGTGLHRYIFLLFKQTNGKIETKDLPRVPNNTADGRRLQKARDIAKRFNLQLVAGNFYLAEWDDYVPVLHAQLGFGK
ncbi:phosphatidylethanolamine-binding protein homolog F40A3.3-like [Ruditapes philippinarum]|uniref:phosphatidylethanolamine-binding protein homolog F40A3.3-like n=1 Tax=Ruditapes philippinarum TaxID=129788 RepID=UPI00295AB2BC|nr:phosphatidylethanolamine-binding protein homolog F40A3.3-like [Ruditapes philippinarum]